MVMRAVCGGSGVASLRNIGTAFSLANCRTSLRSQIHSCPILVKHAATRTHALRCSWIHASATLAKEDIEKAGATSTKARVRFAPSPTGYLHVGGARTALFNWLYARNHDGTFIIRIEDTDRARSTTESETAVLEDLKWLGLQWDEGPDVGGPYGPYRQSDRTEIYNKLVQDLMERDLVFPCFCTEEELEQSKKESEAKHLPPIYRGKWAKASKEEVEAERSKGTPYCYRFKVPKNKEIVIKDSVRGDVKFNTDTLGDFVIMRSNGLPVYNFCVAVDDALMKITHVIRAEEHLPNTLRQVLIYQAFGWDTPDFAHISLILAADKSKLSKRHGATSVGEFKERGYLAPAMINFLSLLGWNDGTEQELFTRDELKEKFSLDRVNKSAAVFDTEKLDWMNGQYLHKMALEELTPLLAEEWTSSSVLKKKDSAFVKTAARLVQTSLHTVSDATSALKSVLDFPFNTTLGTSEVSSILEDNFKEIVEACIEAHKSGVLSHATKEEDFKKWLKEFGKSTGRKGKRLFMPIRVALTGSMSGPEIGGVLELLSEEDDDVVDKEHFRNLDDRISTLKDWLAKQI